MVFDYDIFISLASSSKENSWEKNLIIFLETLTKRLLGRNVIIISSDECTSEEHQNEIIKKSNVFVVVITDNYLKSDKNLKEFQLIESSTHGDNSKIFKVLKANIPAENQPANILNLLSYDFFEKKSLQEDDQNYYESMIFEIERHYWTKLTDLAFDIYKVIDPENATFEKPAIYISETSGDQNKNRESIIRELKRLGYCIYPDKNLSLNAIEFKEEVTLFLSKSCLSIHLIGNTYGDVLENSELSAMDFQNQIASEYYDSLSSTVDNKKSSKFSRLIWLDSDLKISSEKQKIFVDSLKRDTDLLKGASLIQTPLEHFKAIVISEIKNKIVQTAHSFNKANPEIKVYLIHESKSFDKISAISANLIKNGYEILHSPFLSEERNLLKKHRQNLVDCDAVLIFFDSCDTYWLKSKMNDLMKAPGYGRKKTFTAKAVLIDCENSLPEDIFDNKDFIILKNTDNSAEYSLDPFLEKIQASFV